MRRWRFRDPRQGSLSVLVVSLGVLFLMLANVGAQGGGSVRDPFGASLPLGTNPPPSGGSGPHLAPAYYPVSNLGPWVEWNQTAIVTDTYLHANGRIATNLSVVAGEMLVVSLTTSESGTIFDNASDSYGLVSQESPYSGLWGAFYEANVTATNPKLEVSFTSSSDTWVSFAVYVLSGPLAIDSVSPWVGAIDQTNTFAWQANATDAVLLIAATWGGGAGGYACPNGFQTTATWIGVQPDTMGCLGVTRAGPNSDAVSWVSGSSYYWGTLISWRYPTSGPAPFIEKSLGNCYAPVVMKVSKGDTLISGQTGAQPNDFHDSMGNTWGTGAYSAGNTIETANASASGWDSFSFTSAECPAEALYASFWVAEIVASKFIAGGPQTVQSSPDEASAVPSPIPQVSVAIFVSYSWARAVTTGGTGWLFAGSWAPNAYANSPYLPTDYGFEQNVSGGTTPTLSTNESYAQALAWIQLVQLLIPPPSPTNVEAAFEGNGISVTWLEPNLANYPLPVVNLTILETSSGPIAPWENAGTIYWSCEPILCSNVSGDGQAFLNRITANTTYWIAIESWSSLGNNSSWSNIAPVYVPIFPPPPPPSCSLTDTAQCPSAPFPWGWDVSISLFISIAVGTIAYVAARRRHGYTPTSYVEIESEE